MSFIDQVDPEIVGALNCRPSRTLPHHRRRSAKAREMTDAVNREMRANLPPTEVDITGIDDSRSGLRYPAGHLSAAGFGAARGAALVSRRWLHRWRRARRHALH